jgi:4-amino-4-deoxy-L-arabinose transferase-like glycosyltransferase
MNRQNTPYWLFVAALFVGILSLELIPEGMFFDGLGYAAIARNLAGGVGNFWSLHFSDTLMNPFHDHPPLAFGLESLLFRLLGSSIYVERIYSGSMALLTALLVVCLWRRLGGTDRRADGWLPLFFWAAIPLVTWSYGNNMLENTMGLFTAAAVYGVAAGMDEGGSRAWLALAGVGVWLAVLSKGPVGLFPLGTPLVWWLVFRRGKFDTVVRSTLWVALAAAAAAIVTLVPSAAARHSLSTYVRIQAQSSRQFQTAAHHGTILWRLVRELLPGIGCAAVLLAAGALAGFGHGRWTKHRRPALFCLGVGLSASLPITVTLKQSGFYLVPAFPYFALALGFLVAPVVAALLHRLQPDTGAHSFLTAAGAALLVGALSLAALQVGRVSRDPEKVASVREILTHMHAGEHLGICPDLWTDWQLHAYFARYGQVSLDTNWNESSYLVTDRGCAAELRSPSSWLPVPLRSTWLRLYRAASSTEVHTR